MDVGAMASGFPADGPRMVCALYSQVLRAYE